MERDFTLETYKKLIRFIKSSGYSFQTLQDFILKPKLKVVILRHDSDIWPKNDLKMAMIEHEEDIKASYYFRIPKTFNQAIIKRIAEFGHEIGYHYEDLSVTKGNMALAIQRFENNLALLRKIYPVRTIAMHGRPLSKWDNRLLWEKFDFKEFGIIAEPYLSLDYNKILYLTDTGNRWDGMDISIRDTVNSKLNYQVRSTFQLIDLFNKKALPSTVLLNSHPARWNDNFLIWSYRYLLQTAKNITKKYLKQICLR